MKKLLLMASILIASGLGTVSPAQDSKELFDAKKSREELEVMKGILSTTISFVIESNSKQQAQASAGRQAERLYSLRSSNIDAIYLSGQGALFLIPTSRFRYQSLSLVAPFPNLEENLHEVAQRIQSYSEALESYADLTASQAARRAGRASADRIPAAPEAAPKPPPPPSPPQPPAGREELRKRIEELQQRTKASRMQAEAQRESFFRVLAEVKDYIIEALANYGDSLTTVRPDEYLNLALVIDDFYGIDASAYGGQRTRYEVISARKSWVTDYRAGRLSLEGFKQKVLQYGE